MRKGERTKKRIIEQSALLFNQRGYRSTSMVDVMNETGLERGGLYNHFTSREELLVSAFQHAIGIMKERYKEALGQGNTKMRLTRFLQAFRDLYHNSPIPGGCPIMNLAIETDEVDPFLKEKASQAMQALDQAIQSAIQQGMQAGEVSMSINPEQASTIILSSLEGALMLSRLRQDEKYLNQVVSYLENYIEQITING